MLKRWPRPRWPPPFPSASADAAAARWPGTLLAIPELGSAEESAADLARRLVGEILPKREAGIPIGGDPKRQRRRRKETAVENQNVCGASCAAYTISLVVDRSQVATSPSLGQL